MDFIQTLFQFVLLYYENIFEKCINNEKLIN